MFTACRPGFYKAFAGNTKCSKCPPHSLTHVEATSVCQCEKGYFRAEKDPPSMACTSKSVHFAFENPTFNPFGLFILNLKKKKWIYKILCHQCCLSLITVKEKFHFLKIINFQLLTENVCFPQKSHWFLTCNHQPWFGGLADFP